jgi:hypothetical protein
LLCVNTSFGGTRIIKNDSTIDVEHEVVWTNVELRIKLPFANMTQNELVKLYLKLLFSLIYKSAIFPLNLGK